MDIIQFIFVIAIVGVIVWGLNYLPMPQPFKIAIYVIATVGLLIYLAGAIGHPVMTYHVR